MSLVQIRNRYLEDITWLPAALCDFDINDHTDIWRINISAHLHYLDRFSGLITTAETDRANRYLHPRDKNRFIVSRAMLRIILARYLALQPDQIEFEIGTNKKPFLKNVPLHYNVSHSGDWIIIAVCGTDIGADVEWMNPSFQYYDLIETYFSDDEVKYIKEDKGHSRFFLLWTRKEALTKATAKGLDDDLKNIPALDGCHPADSSLLNTPVNWDVTSFEISPGYVAGVAAAEQAGSLRFWDVNLSAADF